MMALFLPMVLAGATIVSSGRSAPAWPHTRPFVGRRVSSAPLLCQVDDAPIVVTQPSQGDCEAMGLRDWPSTVVRGSLEDSCEAGAMRYVLEGTGRLACDGTSNRVPIGVNVGDLIRVNEQAELRWEPDDSVAEMVILSPEYRGPPLLPVVGAFAALCVLLIAATSGGSS